MWEKGLQRGLLDYRDHLPLSLTVRYVYDHLGENHDNIMKELVATIATFAVTTLWLGPCEIVYIWSVFNCFGLNFELWVQKFFQLEPFAKLEVRSWAASGWEKIDGSGATFCCWKRSMTAGTSNLLIQEGPFSAENEEEYPP